MTRFLLDTNIVSDSARGLRSESLVAWLRERDDEELFVSSVTMAEIQRGIFDLPAGRKRTALQEWFDGPLGLVVLFRGRVLPFEERAAIIWARLMAEGRAAGRPRNAFDTLIAAIAQANNCVVVTDNEKDFFGVKTVNPLRPGR